MNLLIRMESSSVPNSGCSSSRLGSGVGGKKKVDERVNGSKSSGKARGKAPAHGVSENRVVPAHGVSENRIVVWDKEQQNNRGNKGGKSRRFRCGGALCLLLPLLPGKGKGKGKGIGIGKGENKEEAEGGGCISISISMSRRVSLEKFECGSWASSGMVAGESLYFDLPMELIRNSVGAAETQSQSPVKAACVFDDANRKGLPPIRTNAKLGQDSGAASPCIITPRLRKAREEFNALLEAQAHSL